jgi:hypothetical protein
MLDKDAVINSLVDHLSDVGTSMLGFSAGTATKALAKVLANNYITNSKYGELINAFFDKDGNFLTDSDTYFNALKEYASQKPLEIAGLKFNHKDVEAIQKYFSKYAR